MGEIASASREQAQGIEQLNQAMLEIDRVVQQNAANAPEPTATYMKQAAATCNALVAQGQDQNAISAAIRGALGGAALPGPCL